MLSLENANFETQILYQGLSTNDRSTFFYKHSPLTVKTDRQTEKSKTFLAKVGHLLLQLKQKDGPSVLQVEFHLQIFTPS